MTAWARCAWWVAVLSALLGAAPVGAQTRDELWAVCEKGSGDAGVRACTTLIQSGHETNNGLAIAYSNRGTHYQEMGQLDQAIQDQDQAIRLNPADADNYY